MVSGMNKFLKMMDITFRRDPNNFRPRINKNNSQKDQEQKLTGDFFLVETLESRKKIGNESEEEKEEQKVEPEEEEKKEKPAKKKNKKKKKGDDSDEGFVE